jgi:hypothetical protein
METETEWNPQKNKERETHNTVGDRGPTEDHEHGFKPKVRKITAHVHLGWLLTRLTRASQHAPRPTWSLVSGAPSGWMGVLRVLPVGVVG